MKREKAELLKDALTDLLIRRIFRLIDGVELMSGGTILDGIYRATPSGMINSRELRNLIANKKISKIYIVVANMSSALLAVVPNVIAYAGNITRRYPV